jgi:hypothetical protein
VPFDTRPIVVSDMLATGCGMTAAQAALFLKGLSPGSGALGECRRAHDQVQRQRWRLPSLAGLDLLAVARAFIERTRDRDGAVTQDLRDVVDYLRAASSNTRHTPISGHQALWDEIVEGAARQHQGNDTMTTKLGSLAECRGYLRAFLGREKCDAMKDFELAAAVRPFGAELVLDVSAPASPAPARADSVYREDTKGAPKFRDRHAAAYAASWRRDGESTGAYLERTREGAAAQSGAAGNGKTDRRLDAYNASWGEGSSRGGSGSMQQ